MLQLKLTDTLCRTIPACCSIAGVLLLTLVHAPLAAQGYDDTFEMRNKIKLELQYADYGEYEYPEPLIFQYGMQSYFQAQPYIVNFPEKRALLKFTRTVGGSSAVSAKYQFSDMRPDVNQHLAEAKWTHSFGNITGLIGGQVIHDTRGYEAYQPGIGVRWDLGPLTIIQADAQYYMRGEDAVDAGGRIESLNLRFKIRQVLTLSTAVLVEYLYYNADGDQISFDSRTISLWLSQFLPTQTAVHLNLRLYDNTLGIQSVAPSLEIAQYLNWATILRIKYRYYANESENISLGEQDVIIPDNLRTHAVSLQLNRELNAELQVYGKYRYYSSNMGVQMNTYLMGLVMAF